MEVVLHRPDNPAMTFDEVSMERSKSFVKALQELKNLRPQLYSAAEYCEKSYLHNEQKQMVLDNLKDYAVRALVNAVDHLGTVAYKLTDLLEQQTLEVSTIGLKASYLNQPDSVSKKVHFSPQLPTDARQNYFQAHSLLQPSDTPASKTLSWHLTSETKSTLKGASQTSASNEISKPSDAASGVFQLVENEDNARTKSAAAPFPASNPLVPSLGTIQRELEGSKPLTAFRSFDNPNRQIIRAPVRSRSVLSAFFVKQKAMKLKAGYAA
ncbi:hypothetical protein V6N13_022028 [Hibiscus sabdariffa]|uniref:Protein ABIL1 n=1 Tax=Hibiscus sabdariffa TaxID=183260 RepID=A0ABR1ZIV2_9ROSI